MSRALPVIRREFTEFVRTKMFVIGTLFGPLFYVLLLGVPILLMDGGGGERTVTIVDATEGGLGERVAAALSTPAGQSGVAGGDADDVATRFTIEVVAPDADTAAQREALLEEVQAETLDGYLWLPAGVLGGAAVRYEGRNATNFEDLARIRTAVQQATQVERLRAQGIDPGRVAVALAPVPFEARKTGRRTASGTPESMLILAQVLAWVIYFAVFIYGTAVLRGVMEEKKDRIAEVVMSSIRAQDLMLGKVLGIGAAGLVQMLVWVGFAVLALTTGEELIARFGGGVFSMPDVPQRVLWIFLTFFLGGYFLFSTLFAALAAMATSDQEAQQFIMPVTLVLVFGFFLMFAALTNPDGTTAIVGSLVPFTSPMVMPVRAALTDVPLVQLLGSVVLLLGSGLAMIWIAARIYRIGMLATGKRPSLNELWRWLRTA